MGAPGHQYMPWNESTKPSVDALLLKHQAIGNHGADEICIVLGQFYTKILVFRETFLSTSHNQRFELWFLCSYNQFHQPTTNVQ